MRIILFLIILLMGCAKMPPRDDTPPWNQNNRYAMEMQSSCNVINKALGIIGCGFRGKIDGSITFPRLWYGNITFESGRCLDFTINTTPDQDTIVNLGDITDKTCSYEVLRKVSNINGYAFDNLILGRIFILKIDDNPYERLLRFSVKDNEFEGVGWYQLKYQDLEPKIMIKARGNKGVVKVICGDDKIIDRPFDESPFELLLPESKSCDYQISVINDDSPYIEYATYVKENNGPSLDITKPVTYIQKKRRRFSFRDKNKNGKYMVYAVQVNDRRCIKGNVCSDVEGLEKYSVRAYTMSGRIFSGEYYPETNTWKVY